MVEVLVDIIILSPDPKFKDYLRFLNDTLLGGAGYTDEISFNNGPLKEEGFVLESNQVEIVCGLGSKIISKEVFGNINMELAHKAFIKNWIRIKERLFFHRSETG